MKLTKEHIGKKVKKSVWVNYGIMVAIGLDPDLVWIRMMNDDNQINDNDDFILIEDPKKPSERIKEIALNSYLVSKDAMVDPISNSIVDYLDEEFEKKLKGEKNA